MPDKSLLFFCSARDFVILSKCSKNILIFKIIYFRRSIKSWERHFRVKIILFEKPLMLAVEMQLTQVKKM